MAINTQAVKKILKITIPLLLILISAFAFIVYTTDYKAILTKYLKSQNVSFDVKQENINVTFAPLPKISIRNLLINNNLNIREINIELSLISIIQRSIESSDIIIYSADLSSEAQYSKLEIFKNIKKILRKIENVSNLKIQDLNILNKDGTKYRIDEILIKKEQISGKISNNLSFFINKPNANSVKIKIFSLNSEHNLNLRFDNKEEIVDCDLDSSILNLVSDQKNEQNKTKITAKIKNIENLINLEDLKIKGNDIDATGSVLNLSAPSVKLNIEYLDTQNLFSKLGTLELPVDLFKNISSLDIGIKKMIHQKETLNNLTISGSGQENDEILIDKFDGVFESGGVFSCIGSLQNDSHRMLFDGKFILKHNNINALLNNVELSTFAIEQESPLTIISNVVISDTDLVLNDLFVQFYNVNTTGNMSIKFIGETPRINFVLSVSDISTEKQYPIISYFQKSIMGVFEGTNLDDYMLKFNPIRTVSHIGNYYLSLKNLDLGFAKFDNLSTSIYLSKNDLKIHSLDLKNNEMKINSSLSVNTSELNPKININLKDSYVDKLSTIYEVFKKINNISFKNVELRLIGINNSINDFMSNISIDIQNNKHVIEIFDVSGSLPKEGKAKLNGNFLPNPFKMNLNYNISDLDVSDINYFNSIGLINSGKLNVNGYVYLVGEDIDEIFSNSYSENIFTLKNGSMNTLSIDEFINFVRNKAVTTTDLESKKDPFVNYGTTNITQMNGNFKFKKGAVSMENITFLTKNSSSTGNGIIDFYKQTAKFSYIFNFYLNEKINNNFIYSGNVDIEGKFGEYKRSLDVNESLKTEINSRK